MVQIYRWTCLQGRNSVTDVENNLVVTSGGSGGGKNWEMGNGYIHTIIYKCITNENLLYSTGVSTECCVMT